MNTPKSAFPYLVDIGVTTVCAKGCRYCYAGASKEGRHSDSYWTRNELPGELKKANVFEVVLGGYGEPTMWDDGYDGGGIASLAESFSGLDFKVGMTTANYDWGSAKGFSRALASLDSVAVSCNSMKDLVPALELAKAIRENVSDKTSGRSWFKRPAVSIQTISGVVPWNQTMEILRTAVKEPWWIHNVTILGFHRCGRAKDLKGYEVPKKWVKDLKDMSDGLKTYAGLNVGIDATMASVWEDELLAAGVERYRLCGSEGRQTCFVDAVEKTVKPSSFSDQAFGWEKDKFLEVFAKF